MSNIPFKAAFFAVATSESWFPFITCQWKCDSGPGSHTVAMNQGARDGAAIVNALHAFHVAAGVSTPSAVNTCHWSLTCDVNTAKLFVHWRTTHDFGTVHQYMKLVDEAPLRSPKGPDNAEMVAFRNLLRNILNWSVGTRLERIKALLRVAVAEKTNKRQKRDEEDG